MGYVARSISAPNIRGALFNTQGISLLTEAEFIFDGNKDLWKCTINFTNLDTIYMVSYLRCWAGTNIKLIRLYIGGVLKATNSKNNNTYLVDTEIVDVSAITGEKEVKICLVDETPEYGVCKNISLIPLES